MPMRSRSKRRLISLLSTPCRLLIPIYPFKWTSTSKYQSEERQQVRQRIADLQQRVGSEAPVRIVVGPIKGALLEAIRQFDADLLMIGRSPESGAFGRIRDLSYALIRDSPFPVLSI